MTKEHSLNRISPHEYSHSYSYVQFIGEFAAVQVCETCYRITANNGLVHGILCNKLGEWIGRR